MHNKLSKKSFTRIFDEDDCYKMMESVIYHKEIYCPYCSHVGYYDSSFPYTRYCKSCKNKFKVTYHTPLKHSLLTLQDWFYIFYLTSYTKPTVSLFVKELRVVETTARRICKKISELDKSFKKELIKQIVEKCHIKIEFDIKGLTPNTKDISIEQAFYICEVLSRYRNKDTDRKLVERVGYHKGRETSILHFYTSLNDMVQKLYGPYDENAFHTKFQEFLVFCEKNGIIVKF